MAINREKASHVVKSDLFVTGLLAFIESRGLKDDCNKFLNEFFSTISDEQFEEMVDLFLDELEDADGDA